MVNIINQIFEIAQKAETHSYDHIQRNLDRINHELETEGYSVINPIGRPYKQTDADIEANFVTALNSGSKIVRVMKPIIYKMENGQNTLVQKGIVIVE